MGDTVADAVTNDFGRVHDTTNCYVAGPALFPTVGSPNPMLTGTALARRTADHILRELGLVGQPLEVGFQALFDGTKQSFNQWHKVGAGTFDLVDGAIVARPDPSGELGLFYFARFPFADFILRLQFKLSTTEDNSGVFVRFRYPERRWDDLI